MSDFGLLGDLGTALPSLEKFTLIGVSHPAHVPENSNSQSGGLKCFEALETLSISGSFVLIQHLLGLIDSPYLKSITVSSVVDGVHNEDDMCLGIFLLPQ
jgi:hypothetical protein